MNPVADEIRVVTEFDQNLRIDPTTLPRSRTMHRCTGSPSIPELWAMLLA